MNKRILDPRLLVASVVIIGLLLINTVFTYSNIQKLHTDTGWVIHTHKVIESVNNIISLITVAGAKQRGYIITGDVRYLESSNSVFSAISEQFRVLENLIRDSPEQLSRASLLKTIVDNRLKILNENTLLMKKKGLNGTHNSIGTNLGKMAMDRLREQANAMIEAENKLLKIRTQRSEYIYHVTLLTSLLTNFISLLMIAAFLYVLRIHLIARQKSENILFEERELLRESEARFRKLSESLSRSNEELEQFAYVASHDLKEPLHTISSFADLFVRRYAAKMETKEKEYLDAIKQAALQGKTLVKELLEFSRIGKSQVLESVDLFETVQKVKVNLDMIIKESNAHIECSDHLPAVKCTSVEMGQLFQNLIENSIKYRSSEPPKIHISAVKSENNMWLLSVKDNGIGIDAEYKDRIFGIFERLHSRSEYAGTGIGLAICKKIVEHYGGRIWVESESGKGSLFCFTIPGLSSN